MDERSSVALIDALARVWSRIRTYHPDVPGVVLLAAPAANGMPNSLGHFAPLRWKGPRAVADPIHEVVVIAEYLDRSVEEILSTLLHEAAHALNHQRGVHDCSRSQYHNKKYKETAEALGLDVKQVANYGFALTTLALGTATRYEDEIQYLQQVLIHRRRPVLATGRGSSTEEDQDADNNEDSGTSSSRSRKAVCRCEPQFIIRVSKTTLERTVIRCETCDSPFVLA